MRGRSEGRRGIRELYNGAVDVSFENRVYANQINPLRDNLTRSDVVNTLTNDCCLRCGSFDQIEDLVESANARKSISLGSDIKSADLSRKPSYSEDLKNLIDSSTSVCLISNSCSDSFDLNKHSSLCFSNSDFMNVGAKNLALMEENRYAETDFGFIIENKELLSNTNLIFYNNFFSGEIFFNNFSLILGETSDNSCLNLPFLAFLPNSTDHLINSCSSLECSFFNNSLAFLSRSINLSLISSDQFTQRNLDILDLSLGSAANVMDAIYIAPLAFNSSNFSNSLILSTTVPLAIAATFTSGNSFLNLFNSSSGTETVTFGILSTSDNYLNTSKYVNVYKSFDSDFSLMPAPEIEREFSLVKMFLIGWLLVLFVIIIERMVRRKKKR